MKYIFFYILLLSLCVYAENNYAQCVRDMKYGYTIPVTNQDSKSHILRILVVFAEVDYTGAPEGTDVFTAANGNTWDTNHDGVSELPADADQLIDYKDLPNPVNIITRTYSEATFGQFKVLGDYYPKVIKVPYKRVGFSPGAHVKAVVHALNAEPDNPAGSGTLTTAHGLRLSDFDLWDWNENADYGAPKTLKDAPGTGKRKAADVMLILWRNNVYMHGQTTAATAGVNCNAGFGLTSVSVNDTLKNLTEGVQTASSYNVCGPSALGGAGVFLVEFFHGVFGPNNWHSGGGDGVSTFLANPNNFSITGQFASTMVSVCGFDRWAMDWGNPDKKFITSVLDSTGKNEIETDNFSLDNPSLRNGGVFILRDHVTTGDAIRIVLPYLHTLNPAVINQYLWLENRRFKASTDDYLNEVPCADNKDVYGTAHPKGVPGLYTYIQVGKDARCGVNANFYNSVPNDKMNWLMPVTAEGNYDFDYRMDLVPCTKNLPWLCGNWGNTNIPIDKSQSEPNPLTGFSDLFDYYDSNGDGKLHSGDDVQPGLSEVVKDSSGRPGCIDCNGDYIWHNWNSSGDFEDGFSAASGHKKLSLSTNPAPTPVYTYHGNANFYGPNTSPPDKTENRTIWLNGLSIEILDEDALKDGTGAMKVRISWDNFNIENNVRWCGNIELMPNHLLDTSYLSFDSRHRAALDIYPKRTVLLDRGTSATQYIEYQPGLFTAPTCMTCEPNAYIYLEANAHLHITNGSTLELMAGSELALRKGADVVIDKGGKLIIDDGAELYLDNGAKVNVDESASIELHNTKEGKGILNLSDVKTPIQVKGKIIVGDEVNYSDAYKTLFHFKKSGSAVRGSGVVLAGR